MWQQFLQQMKDRLPVWATGVILFSGFILISYLLVTHESQYS
jgi:hypothetical protein